MNEELLEQLTDMAREARPEFVDVEKQLEYYGWDLVDDMNDGADHTEAIRAIANHLAMQGLYQAATALKKATSFQYDRR